MNERNIIFVLCLTGASLSDCEDATGFTIKKKLLIGLQFENDTNNSDKQEL